MAPHRPSSAMTTRFAHLDIGRSPGGLRPSTLISLGLTFSTWISRTSGSRNVGSICGIGALTEIGGAMWTCGAAAGRPDRAPAAAPFRHARAAAIRSQRRRADRCLSALAWIALAVPCSVQCHPHRAASMLCGVENPLPRKPCPSRTRPARFDQSKAISWRGWGRGFRVLEPAREEREGNKGFSGSGAERAAARSAAS